MAGGHCFEATERLVLTYAIDALFAGLREAFSDIELLEFDIGSSTSDGDGN